MTEQSKKSSKGLLAKGVVTLAIGLFAAKTLLLTTVEAGTVGVRFSSASGVSGRWSSVPTALAALSWLLNCT